ncbi:hypothetical protein RB195_013400 [Necator americanus]|uniref:Endonuclease/exonuclease/phosphatase domain-containing protein n=1 Tax=Necator americanus TaxID=51031 RepID=A0ABR1DVH6_NECAM
MATGERRPNLRLLRTSLILDQGDTRTTRHGDCLRLCAYNARTVSTVADLHALLGAAERIKFHVIALQETKCRRSDVRQMNDGTLVIRGEKVPSRNVSDVGLLCTHVSSISSILTRSCHVVWPFFASALCAKNPSVSSTATHQHQQLMNPNWTRFRGTGGSSPQREVLLQIRCRANQKKN